MQSPTLWMVGGAALFGVILARWERGRGPESALAARAPWVFVRLAVVLLLGEFFVLAAARGFPPVPITGLALLGAGLLLLPWSLTRLAIGRVPALLLVAGPLSALHFGGDPRRALATARAWHAFRRRDLESLAREQTRLSELSFDSVSVMTLAAQHTLEGKTREALDLLDSLDDFDEAPPRALLRWHAEIVSACAGGRETQSMAASLPRELSPGGVDRWRAHAKARGLADADELLEGWRRGVAGRWGEMSGATIDGVASAGGDWPARGLVEFEARLRSNRADLEMEWTFWCELSRGLDHSSEAQRSLRLAEVEPLALGLVARAWTKPSRRPACRAVLRRLERAAVAIDDDERSDRVRLNLVLGT